MKELESNFSAFDWSGPELNNKNAKVLLRDLCQPKSEGCLGLRSLKEKNTVNGLDMENVFSLILMGKMGQLSPYLKENLLGDQ